MTSLRGHGSPVPTQTSFLSRGEIAIAPIDCVPALSKTGAQSVPPFVDRHTPPPAAPAYSRFGSRSVPATVATRPPETAGPIARQVIVGPGVGEGDGEAAGEALGAGEAGVSGSAARDGEQANAIAATASGAIRRSVRTSRVDQVSVGVTTVDAAPRQLRKSAPSVPSTPISAPSSPPIAVVCSCSE